MSHENDETAGLLAALEQRDKPLIRRAVDALIAVVPTSPALTDRLTGLLSDSRRQNLWAIAYVLGHLQQPPIAAIERLVESLDHPDPDIRWAIALLLTQLAESDRTVANRLITSIRSGTPTQRRMAIYSIRNLGLADMESREALLHALGDNEPLVRLAAVTSLKYRRDLDIEISSALLKLFLNDPHGGVRNAAAVTLAQLGAPSEECLAALEKASRSEDGGLRKAANAALGLIKKRSAPSG